jgi:hypothetical protein
MVYENFKELSDVAKNKFFIMDKAIEKGTLEKPKPSLFNSYLWVANFTGEDKYKRLRINFSWWAFLLGAFWYIHFGLVKEITIVMCFASFLLGLIPPDFYLTVNPSFSVVLGCYFTGTRYSKYKLTGYLSGGNNLFMSILMTFGLSVIVVFIQTLINRLIYDFLIT